MPGSLRLPCSPKQALALYQHLFGCPAGLGQLQAALRRAPERRVCPTGLELPVVLLELEQSRWAQEQLLWDLELLTGAGLGLFWPPRAQFHGLWGQGVRSWWDKPCESTVGGPELLLSGSSRLHLSPQASNSLNHGCSFSVGPGAPLRPPWCPCRGQCTNVGEARSNPRRTSWPELPTPDRFQGLKYGGCGSTAEAGGSEFQDLTLRGEKGEAGTVTQRAPGLSGLPEPRDPNWVLCWDRVQELAELEKLLMIEVPRGQEQWCQGPEEETPQGQRQQAHQGQPKSKNLSGETPQGESQEAPSGQIGKSLRAGALLDPRGATPPGQEESLSSGGCTSQAQEEGDCLDIRGHLRSSLGEQMQPGERGSPGPQGRTTQPLQDQEPAPAQEGVGTPHSARSPDPAMPAACTAEDSGLQEGPEAPKGHPAPGVQESAGNPERESGEAGESRAGAAEAPATPKAPKSAWPPPPDVSAVQQESALQRLLELHRAARRRRGRDREQQRLRVLEGLRIARSRRCRVHPLGPPLQQAQLPLQEDAAGQRRALRELLQQVHRERTGRLRAQGARNTQNFQQLLWSPRALEPE